MTSKFCAILQPQRLEDFVGNRRIFDPLTGTIAQIYSSTRQAGQVIKLPSLILRGPSGTGKTSLGQIYAPLYDRSYVLHRFGPNDYVSHTMNAALSKIDSPLNSQLVRKHCLLFDEAHRISKQLQDKIMALIDNPNVTVIFCTTVGLKCLSEGLLSRCLEVHFDILSPQDILELCVRALNTSTSLDRTLPPDECVSKEAVVQLAIQANGDARKALLWLEQAIVDGKITSASVNAILCNTGNTAGIESALISGLIKAIRASDPQGAIFYVAMLIKHATDPLYIARRLIVSASEDIGLANPQALSLAVSCHTAASIIGLPECQYALAETAIYLARSPKSNAAATALQRAQEAAESHSIEECLPPPDYRHGHGGPTYVYPHQCGGYVVDDTLPEALRGSTFYAELDVHQPV
ncbi:Recombination factor protein RarA [Giardia muris]|uniref:Recombination factor protein RarA n=1 Tax=Giardia muris TaxID=5742 RepID=A0A4Z1SX55_GIAMU|nr:Recombination factor protein RarA [Giardia muris]|eukprot:TNJ30372.1 Recombination factor protein RarA [Giardia muris]